MNLLAEYITPERVAISNHITSKKKVLEIISSLIVVDGPTLSQSEVFDSLCERERLGSTGMDHGVAIPHGRMKGIEHAVCAFLKLKEGVDYDSADGVPVDLFCALIVPEDSTSEHLNILSLLAEMFSNNVVCDQLRNARTQDELYLALTSWRSDNLQRASSPQN